MSQINVDPNDPAPRSDSDGAKTAATNNLTWAVAMVLIIAAVAVAIVYVAHNLHVF